MGWIALIITIAIWSNFGFIAAIAFVFIILLIEDSATNKE